MEIEIRRTALWGLLAAALLPALLLLGQAASPRDRAGRPLLLPDVRAVEAYRRTASGWLGAWQALDEQLAEVLAAPDTALLAQSRGAQQAFDRAIAVARQVEGTESPAALLGLREQALAAAAAYVEASVAVNRWLSVPTAENAVAAQKLCEQAQAALATIAANQWLAEPEAKGR